MSLDSLCNQVKNSESWHLDVLADLSAFPSVYHISIFTILLKLKKKKPPAIFSTRSTNPIDKWLHPSPHNSSTKQCVHMTNGDNFLLIVVPLLPPPMNFWILRNWLRSSLQTSVTMEWYRSGSADQCQICSFFIRMAQLSNRSKLMCSKNMNFMPPEMKIG